MPPISKDAKEWDERYRSATHPRGEGPAAFLRDILPLLPVGLALDLAMGTGRNAVWLAANGWRVTGLDASHVALEGAADLARRHGVTVHWSDERDRKLSSELPGLFLFEADLEHWPLPVSHFNLIVCFRYLQRSLFTAIERALRPGGMLVYESYTVEQLAFHQGPHNPDYLLRPNELREAFPSLEMLFYRELRTGKGIASLLARRPYGSRL